VKRRWWDINALIREPCWEPEPRKFAGSGIQYVSHRFPIKGGISTRDVMIRSMSRSNPLFEMIKIVG
jgi:hypothetical protein